MTANRYLLIKGTLLQETAASFGGNGESSWIDAVVAKDGLGRYTLRGTSIKGALRASLRKLFALPPQEIGDQGENKPSAWHVFNAHPNLDPQSLLRQGVRIHPETGAAQDGALYDLEALPRGLQWPFVMVIDYAHVKTENRDRLTAMTLHTLNNWAQGRCWLGRDVARGLGRFTLKDCLTLEANSDVWPDSREPDKQVLFDRIANGQSQTLTNRLNSPNFAEFKPDGDWTWQEYRIQLAVGPDCDPDGYGCEFLQVGGHAGDALRLDIHDDLIKADKLLLPTDLPIKPSVTSQWQADSVFAFECTNQSVQPYIPGSSLRGALRHRLQWWSNKQKLDWDRAINTLFGSEDDTEQASLLLAGDVHLPDDRQNAWQALLQTRHAEDEFAGGVYGSSLFQQLVLVEAQFETRWFLEVEKSRLPELEPALQAGFELAKLGYVRLGKGGTHLKWQIETITPLQA